MFSSVGKRGQKGQSGGIQPNDRGGQPKETVGERGDGKDGWFLNAAAAASSSSAVSRWGGRGLVLIMITWQDRAT